MIIASTESTQPKASVTVTVYVPAGEFVISWEVPIIPVAFDQLHVYTGLPPVTVTPDTPPSLAPQVDSVITTLDASNKGP